jgi:hypothetical protein
MAMGQGSRSKKHRHSGIVLAGILLNVTVYKIAVYNVRFILKVILCANRWRWDRVRRAPPLLILACRQNRPRLSHGEPPLHCSPPSVDFKSKKALMFPSGLFIIGV